MIRRDKESRKNSGQGLVEMLGGILLLIPIGFFLLDITAVVLGNQANDELAKRACRAAATQNTRDKAQETLNQLKGEFKGGGIFKEIDTLKIMSFDTRGNAGVRVQSRVTIKLPVPVPLLEKGSEFKFDAEAQEPIVAISARAD